MIPFARSKPIKAISLYNTLSGKKEEFRPKDRRIAKIYTCGPTVYNFAHIGNLRTYVFEDLLRRTIELSGYGVFQVMNITDIDDKIIKASTESGKSLKEITRPFEEHFFEDIAKLNIEAPEKTPRATEHVEEMVSLIGKLIKKGYAYIEEDGSVYFDVSRFKGYGKLTHPAVSGQKEAERAYSDEYEKGEARDFALWKAKKGEEPSWESPWGPGRPGWHIECSAMAAKYLGKTLDIHAGGVDNAFPHHENEIAQSEAATGKPLSRFFTHGEHLLVDGTKMAKSAGNFYTLRDIEDKGYDPLAFRYLCLQTHYRSKMNFTWEALGAAASALEGLRQTCASLREQSENEPKMGLSELKPKKAQAQIFADLADDLNAPKALASLWSAVKDSSLSAKERLSAVEYADKALGIRVSEKPEIMEIVSEELKELADKRDEFRKKGDYSEADKLRKDIENKGYEVIDAEKGYKLRKKRQ
jgi:cysteinyl-tRNA synthetase